MNLPYSGKSIYSLFPMNMQTLPPLDLKISDWCYDYNFASTMDSILQPLLDGETFNIINDTDKDFFAMDINRRYDSYQLHACIIAAGTTVSFHVTNDFNDWSQPGTKEIPQYSVCLLIGA